MKDSINKWSLLSGIALVIGQPSVVFADQCQLITQEQAVRFLSKVKVGDMLGLLCEPCDQRPDEYGRIPLVKVASMEVKIDGSYAEVYVNHESIDLAYTYVVTDESEYSMTVSNAAKLVDCYCEDVTVSFNIPKD